MKDKDKVINTSCDPSTITDGRKKYEWKTFYSDKVAIKEMRFEFAYIIILLALTLIFIFLTWKGTLAGLLDINGYKQLTFNTYAYFVLGGLLGGITFGMKWFYRAIARGLWHLDRRYWRVLSPAVSMVLGLVAGTMVRAGFMNTQTGPSGSACIAIGFFAGYFADEAVSKMHDVAVALFGSTKEVEMVIKDEKDIK